MVQLESRSLGTGIAALSLVLLLTLPSLIGIASHLRNPKPRSSIYEDKDGAATEKSNAEYTAKIPKIFLTILSISSLFLSIALTILDVARPDGRLTVDWLNAAQSVCLCSTLSSWILTFLVSDRFPNIGHCSDPRSNQEL